jgi:hypothetical protein
MSSAVELMASTGERTPTIDGGDSGASRQPVKVDTLNVSAAITERVT